MRRLLTVIAIANVCVFVALGDLGHGAGYTGGQVWYDRVAGYYSGNGGEFTLSSDGGPGLLLTNGAYVAGKTAGIDVPGRNGTQSEGFQTFCLEDGEYTAQPMQVWVSTAFLNGSQPGSHAWKGGANGDDLDARTAYLYTRFAVGGLSNYNYNNGPGRQTSASELQEAIWYIEQEIGSANGQALTWVNEAAAAIASGKWKGIGSVRVLQMYWDQNGNGEIDPNDLKQDQLWLTVPSPQASLLGAIGITLVGALRRR